MKTLIAVTADNVKALIFNDAAYKRLAAAADLTWQREGQHLADIIGDYEAVITGWDSERITPEVLSRATRLRFIGHTAGTVAPYVDQNAYERGIRVVNANAALAHSTAELALTLILTGLWRVKEFSAMMDQGLWREPMKDSPDGLYGKTVGIIGLGAISRILIGLLKPFHCRILIRSRYCSPELARELHCELTDLDELLKVSDVVTLHDTLNAQTAGMIGQRELGLMKSGALFVNTARGPIVDQAALAAEVRTGRLGAAVDVYDKEPVQGGHPLVGLPNVVHTPHIGGYAKVWIDRALDCVTEDLIRLQRGEELKHEVTRDNYIRLSIY
ncbi:MAG: hydroxyacid dehydrogenase [Paenibacillaceae bacterium]|jgi:phosphoglycerate dehydrogenase-like enzyme|nr:hydroxyacid dehydrogenase [Paenibacillaceae bacterium]